MYNPSSFSATLDGRSPRSASRIPPLSATQQFPSAPSNASLYSTGPSLSATMGLTPAISAPAAFVSSIPFLNAMQSLTPLSTGLTPSAASPRRIPPLLNPMQQFDGAQQGYSAAVAAVSPRSGRLAPLSPSPFANTLSAQRLSTTQPAALSPFAVAQHSLLAPQVQMQTSFPMPTVSNQFLPLSAPLTPTSPLTPQLHPYGANNEPLTPTPLTYQTTASQPAYTANQFSFQQPPQQSTLLPPTPQQPTYSALPNTLPPPTTLRPLPDIASILVSCQLQHYTPSFYQTGYTDVASLLTMPAERWQSVLDAVTKDMLVRLGRGEVTDEQLQFGHRAVIVAALKREKDFFFSTNVASRPSTAPQPYLMPSTPQSLYTPAASTPLSSVAIPIAATATTDGDPKGADASTTGDKPIESTATPPSLPSDQPSHLMTVLRHWCCSFTIGGVFLLFSGAMFLLWQQLQVPPSASTSEEAPEHAVTGFGFLKALCVIGFVVGGICLLAAMRLFCKYPEHRRCGEWCGECCVPSEDGCCAGSECCVKWRNWCTVCCANLPCDTCCASCRTCCATDPNAPGCCDALCKADPNAVTCTQRLGDCWTCVWKGVLTVVVAVCSVLCCTNATSAAECAACCSVSNLCGKSSAPFSCRQCVREWGCGGLCCDEDGTDECCVPCRAACDHSSCCSGGGGCWQGCQQSTCYKIVCCQCKISVV